MVSITALSAVSAAFSACAGVCATAPELNARTPASAAAAKSDPIPRPIAISFFLNVRSRLRDHYRRQSSQIGGACKSKILRRAGAAECETAHIG
jgi:hypothetical protein